MRYLLVSCCAIAFGVILSAHPCSARTWDHTWAFGLGGAGAFPYSYHRASQPFTFGRTLRFENGFVASARLERVLSEKGSIQIALDRYGREDQEHQLSVSILSLSSGARRTIGRNQYVELLPSLHLGRWTDQITNGSITSVRPGFEAGAGTVGALGRAVALDLGVKFRYSTGWPNARWRSYDTEDYRGLRQVVVGGTLLFGI